MLNGKIIRITLTGIFSQIVMQQLQNTATYINDKPTGAVVTTTIRWRKSVRTKRQSVLH
jgi:hypothetical protein